jgi:hypothetical protein
MATHQYNKLQQGGYPNIGPGSNWVWIRLDFSLMPGVATDTYNLYEVKNHWVVKNSFYRVTVDGGVATATFDIQTAETANDIHAAVNLDRGDDIMTRGDGADDDSPVPITSDSMITGTLNTAAASDGIVDFFIEIVVPNPDVDSVDSLYA